MSFFRGLMPSLGMLIFVHNALVINTNFAHKGQDFDESA